MIGIDSLKIHLKEYYSSFIRFQRGGEEHILQERKEKRKMYA